MFWPSASPNALTAISAAAVTASGPRANLRSRELSLVTGLWSG